MKPTRTPALTPMKALALSVALDATAVIGLALFGGTAAVWTTAAFIHVAGVGAVWAVGGATRSSCALSAAPALTLPLVGPCTGGTALRPRGRGEIERFVVDDAAARRAVRRTTFTAEDARRLAEGLSTCETLLSG